MTLTRLNAAAAKAQQQSTIRGKADGASDVIGPPSTGSGNFTDGVAAGDFVAPVRKTAADITP